MKHSASTVPAATVSASPLSASPLPVEPRVPSSADTGAANDFLPRDFASRHIGPSDPDIAAMLDVIGVPSVDALIGQALPDSIRFPGLLEVGAALSESEALAHLRSLAAKNQVATSLIGMGYHDTLVPPVILRNILESPAWYTAYTPYQPEISQGRLEALLTFQTMVCDLTGLDVANASLLDEATAAAEAMALARRVATSASMRFLVDAHVHPQTLAVLRTRAEPLGWDIVTVDEHTELSDCACFGGLFQYPGTYGHVPDLGKAIDAVLRATERPLLERSLAQAKIARRIWPHRFITLPNILLGREVVRELHQDDATPQALAAALEPLLRDPAPAIAAMREVRAALGPPGALERCAEYALELARGGKP